MICQTCQTPHGQIERGTEDKRPPTWVCTAGHRQPWGEDAVIHYAPYGPFGSGHFDCGTKAGKTTGYTDNPQLVTCDGCKKASPGLWPDATPVRLGGLRPAKAADLAKRPAWIEAAAAEIWTHAHNDEEADMAAIIEKHWRSAK